MGRFRKEFWIFLAVFVPIVAVILLWRPSNKIGFLDLRILNDTEQTVVVQPCWDLNCIDIHSLTPTVLRPGRSVHSTDQWSTDIGHVIVVGIRKPGSNPRKFSACIVTQSAPQQEKGLVRVSRGRTCFTGPQP